MPGIGRRGLSSDRPVSRGFGTTRFLLDETFRNGEQAVLAADSENRREFNKLTWQIASPMWSFDDDTVERTCRVLGQSRSRRHRHPQLPLAAEPR